MSKTAKLNDLTPDQQNANKGTQRGTGMLEESLRKYGAGRSILVDKNGRIIAGNKTAEGAASIGLEDVIVIETDGTKLVAVKRTDLDLDSPEARELALADNRVGQVNLDFDPAVLAELAQEGVDLHQFWMPDELEALLESVTSESGGGLAEGADPDEIPSEVPTRCKLGDLWKMGGHRLLCGDSTKREDVERLMGGESAQMVWADPPYGISIVAANGYVGGGEAYNIPFGGKKAAKGDVGGTAAHMRKTGKPYIASKGLGSTDGAKPFGSRGFDGAANRIDVGKYAPVIGDETTDTAVKSSRLCLDLYAKAIHVWWGGNYYANTLPASSCWLVWDKENTGNFADCELAWTNQPTAVRLFRHMWNGLMKDSERGKRRVHPTQKPVALAEWAFEKYGSASDIILDPFVGSGMSVIAAEKLKRKVYGLELSPEYCDVILQRWEKATGRTAELIEHGPSD